MWKKKIWLWFGLVSLCSLFLLKEYETERMIYGQNRTNQVDSSEERKEQEENAAEELNGMYAKSYALMDGDSGRLLYGKEELNPMSNASTTKILTCILALENGNGKELVTVTGNAASQPKVHLGMKEGEQYYLKDLLYGLMLESYNDCAVAIAEHIDGSVEAFVKRMNDKAKELGCMDTHFVTPNGLDKEDEEGAHHTTAKDLCRIMKYCTWDSPKAKEFLAITQKPSHSFRSLGGRNFCANNHNLFLSMMDGVLTGKTGYTAKAGYCYVAALERDGKKYCISLLACGWPEHKNYKWADAKKLFQYGLAHYSLYPCPKDLFDIEETDVYGGYVKGELEEWGKKQSISYKPKEGKKIKPFLKADWDKVDIVKSMVKYPMPPIEKGDVLGNFFVKIEEETLYASDICAQNTVYKWDYPSFKKAVLNEIFLH